MTLTNSVAQHRLVSLDVMRGFALCGIIFANLMSFTGFYSLSFEAIQTLGWLDRTVLFAIDFFIEGKFYSVFAMLFGIGFALQYERFKAHNLPFNTFWQRRMVLLMAFGISHMYLIWHGDILTLYSILGLFLLLCVKLNNSQLRYVIVLLLLMPLPIHFVFAFTPDASFWQMGQILVSKARNAFGYGDANLLQLRTSSQAQEVFLANIFSALPRPFAYLKTGRPFQVLGQFLLGVYLARCYLRGQLPTLSTRTLSLMALAAICLNGVYAYIKAITGSPFSLTELGLVQGVVYHIGCTLSALVYMALLLKLSHSDALAKLQPLALIGKLSLTHYLMQTTVCVLLFYGYGLGLMGQVPFYSIVFFALTILWGQVMFSKYWLKYYQQGPMEILWRRFSYSAKIRQQLSASIKST